MSILLNRKSVFNSLISSNSMLKNMIRCHLLLYVYREARLPGIDTRGNKSFHTGVKLVTYRGLYILA